MDDGRKKNERIIKLKKFTRFPYRHHNRMFIYTCIYGDHKKHLNNQFLKQEEEEYVIILRHSESESD